MGQKALQKRHNSIWSFFKFWRHNYNFFRRSSGFTLVELLTVVGIIGILIIGALTILDPVAQFQKSYDTQRKADLSQIQKALETYFNDVGSYPLIYAQGDYRIRNANGDLVKWGSSWAPYMQTLPKDPKSQRKYVYYSTGQAYYLYASLERGKDKLGNPLDPQLCARGDPCVSLSTNNIPSDSCGANLTCNYGVSSSNVSP